MMRIKGIVLMTMATTFFACILLSGIKKEKDVQAITVTDIESGAFSMAGITSVDLPSDLKKIGAGAFTGNKLQNLVIPKTKE